MKRPDKEINFPCFPLNILTVLHRHMTSSSPPMYRLLSKDYQNLTLRHPQILFSRFLYSADYIYVTLKILNFLALVTKTFYSSNRTVS
jgi:hypothetical protein